jgi:hypothetical protein
MLSPCLCTAIIYHQFSITAKALKENKRKNNSIRDENSEGKMRMAIITRKAGTYCNNPNMNKLKLQAL